MADQSDVESALVGLIVSSLFPDGVDAPSVIGSVCKVYRGWPASGALNQDLTTGTTNVTVFPAGEPGRNTTRFLPRWSYTPQSVGLIASVVGNSVTFDGSPGMGQLAAVLVNGVPYVYQVQPNDTPETVAANLASLLRAGFIVTLSGATIGIPGASRVQARVTVAAVAAQEVRRQQQSFRITCWCPTPDGRDLCAKAIDQTLADLAFIDLGDSTQGRLIYKGTLVFDQSQDALLYRRDLIYDVEYATVVASSQPAMTVGGLILNATSSFV